MGNVIEFAKAALNDAQILALISKRAFENDVLYGAPGPGGPPGYDSDLWQIRMITAGKYYKILFDDQIIGGFIIRIMGYQYNELSRIFVNPNFQNRGIGTQAFEFMWAEFPEIKRWTLGTPAWNHRTRHFYEKVGFVETGKDGYGGIFFEKKLAGSKT
ncbi:MAG: GNAT family N-acetyltransferase [Chloroflexi bacterium]|nr:GNAT family N-acetyltransferase [Chloroflexota bacterium]